MFSMSPFLHFSISLLSLALSCSLLLSLALSCSLSCSRSQSLLNPTNPYIVLYNKLALSNTLSFSFFSFLSQLCSLLMAQNLSHSFSSYVFSFILLFLILLIIFSFYLCQYFLDLVFLLIYLLFSSSCYDFLKSFFSFFYTFYIFLFQCFFSWVYFLFVCSHFFFQSMIFNPLLLDLSYKLNTALVVCSVYSTTDLPYCISLSITV